MIHLLFEKHWDEKLLSIGEQAPKKLINGEVPFEWRTVTEPNNIIEFAKSVLIAVLQYYDSKDIVFGLFHSTDYARARYISPFISTHNYCVRVLSCDENGIYDCNISPIYQLGPEYPEEYKEETGASLDKKAIVGFLESSPQGSPEHKIFSIGIDAGIVFKNSKLPHNRSMQIILKAAKNDGLITDLACQNQSTLKKFSWQDLGLADKQGVVA